MQTVVILAAFLLVAGVSAEQPQEVSNVQTGAPVPVQVGGQSSHVVGHTSNVESTGPQAGFGAHQQHFAGGQMVNFEQPMPSAPHYYSPSGMIQVVGAQGVSGEQQQQSQAGATGAKPVAVQTVRHYAAGVPEQYGQPESASIPPNYKPFGSWGLYIGGNPADGYYTNYYKALSSSVADKQQAAGASGDSPAKPQSFVSQASGFGGSPVVPNMKQGPIYPQTVAYQDQGYYPYGDYYTPADLNSGSRVQMMPSVYSSGVASEYQSPAAMYYAADSYAATRKGGSPAAPATFGQKDAQTPMSPVKGYQQMQMQQQQQQQQQRMGYTYNYASQGAAYPQSQVAVQQASYQPQPQSQVVAYPVPVGSQMVGSQPGAEGSYQPYGVHGFTRYAVRPTVVSTEQAYYPTGVHSAPAGQFPVYKQQFVGYQQPMSFYGYPLSQLHYSSGAMAPAFGSQSSQMSGVPVSMSGSSSSQSSYPAVGPQAPQGATVVEHSGPIAHGPVMTVEAASSEKSETSSEADKHVSNKQQQQQQQQQKKA